MSDADLAYGGLRNVPGKSKHTPLAPSPDLLMDKGTRASNPSFTTSYLVTYRMVIYDTQGSPSTLEIQLIAILSILLRAGLQRQYDDRQSGKVSISHASLPTSHKPDLSDTFDTYSEIICLLVLVISQHPDATERQIVTTIPIDPQTFRTLFVLNRSDCLSIVHYSIKSTSPRHAPHP